nr:InlB B-repeat-containing protein [Clostridiales bacterium]
CSYPGDGNAAIGSDAKSDANTTAKSGNIFIYGGEITATASNYAAGIGGGRYAAGGFITLNGGKVTAKGVQGAAIGDGYMGIGTRVDITGGTVIATGGAYSAAIGGSNASRSGVSTVNISGGIVSANAYSYTNSSTHVTTTYYGIGAPDASKAVVNLDWNSPNGSIFATNYNADTINFQNNFVIQGTYTVATLDNIDGNRIVPCTDDVFTVDFYDETGSTSIYSQVKIVDGQTVARPNNPTKTGYRFVEWRLNGVAFDFSTPITANTVLRAHWVEGGDVPYIDANGTSQVKMQGSYDYIETTDEALTLSSGWYVVSGEISLAKRLVISGTVNIILSDGCVFDVPKGITCTGSNTLNIYAQSGGTGELNCKSPDANNAAIGGVSYAVPGNITINGGVINAKGATYSAAIGGGSNHGGGYITINGGEVNAVAGTYSAAVGSAYNSQNSGDNTVIVINGGNVTATSSSGSAIGAGYSAVFDSITINGGYVNASSSGYHAGIGGRAKDTSAQPIVINGGYVSAQGGTNSAAIGARDGVPMKAVTINGGTVLCRAGTNGTGIGDSPTYSNQDCIITLNWTSTEDTYYSDGYTGVVTFAKDFILDGTMTSATTSNIAGATIIPDVDLTVRFLDSDGVTELAPAQTVKNGMTATPFADPEKFGFIFNGWTADGFPFDFSYTLRNDTDIIADFQAIPAVGYIDENGDAQTCTAYYTVDSSTTALSNTWYVVTDDTTVNSRISVSGTVNLIICDGATLTAVKGIEVPDGATLNIYAQSGRTGALEVTLPDNNTSGIGVSNGEDAGTININGGVITVESGVNAAAIGGGNSGLVTFNGGNITANGFVGADMDAANGDGYSVTLNWTNASDSYYATIYKANITLANDFFYSGTTNLVDIPLNGYTTVVPATDFVEYYDGFGNRMACTNYTVLTDASTVYLNDGGWYVVNADTTITRAINVNGTSHIILCDGVTLRAQNIAVGASGAVYIYGQKENTGAFRSVLPASGTGNFAGIGGSGNNDTGEIHILGGKITAHGYNGAAGIGGSALHSATVIEIARATVNADGGSATISGATVGGAGIGGGIQGKSGTITINSGKVIALGGSGAAGIGSGYNATGTTAKQFDVTVYGGEIDAQGGEYTYSSQTYYGAGIGTGVADTSSMVKYIIAYGDINIQGGKVLANLIGAGDGFTPDRPTYNVNITLSWTDAGDYIEADDYSYNTLTFAKDFYLDSTTTLATESNIAGNRIIPTSAPFDINGDGYFDINDVGLLISASAELVTLTAEQEAKADVNGDTVIDAFDAAFLDRKLLLF